MSEQLSAGRASEGYHAPAGYPASGRRPAYEGQSAPAGYPAPGVRRVPPWLVDVIFGSALAMALILIIATSANEARPQAPGAYVFAIGLGALMLLRRHMTRTVLVLSVLGVFAYYTLDYPPIGVAVPMLAALFSAAEAGLMGWAVWSGIVVFVVSMFFRLRDGAEAIGYLLGYESVSNVALFAAAISLGYSVRARRVQARQQTEIAALTEAQVAREAESRVQRERERISRELHDTVGHTLSVISLHAGAGAESVGRNDRAAAEALERIRTASSSSMRELRTMVHILRSDSDRMGDESGHGIRSLSAVGDLVQAARGAGIEIDMDITVTPDDVSAAVDAAAYRVIQESITNVLRHSGATRAEVSAGITDGRLHITVADNGHGAGTDVTSGYGLAGMTERLRILGGSLTSRSGNDRGFTVDATLPARLAS